MGREGRRRAPRRIGFAGLARRCRIGDSAGERPTRPHRASAVPELFAVVTEQICSRLAWPNATALIEALLHSPCGFLRALGARAPSTAPADDLAPGILRSLEDDVEAVNALAEWASGLRVKANQAQKIETEKLRDRRLAVFAEIIKRWPDDGATRVRLCFGTSLRA